MARGSIESLGDRHHRIRWDEPTGKGDKRRQREKTVHCKKKEAEGILRQILWDLENAPVFEPSQMTVKKAFGEFFAEREGNDLRGSSVGNYRSVFKNYVELVCGDMPLAFVDRRCLQAVIGRMNERGLMPYTVEVNHGYLCGFFSWVVKAGYLAESPVKGLTLPEVLSETPGVVLSSERCQGLLGLVKDSFLWRAIFLGLYSGLRPRELFGLSRDDVDLDSNPKGAEISVKRTLSPKGPFPQFGPPKSRTSRRVVVVDPVVREELRKWFDGAPEGFRNRRGPVDFRQVCAKSDGRVVRLGTAQRVFRDLLEGTEFEGFRLHDLRHTHASLLLLDGEAMLVVSLRLGHASILITVKMYGHLLPNSDGDAAARFGALLRGGLGKKSVG